MSSLRPKTLRNRKPTQDNLTIAGPAAAETAARSGTPPTDLAITGPLAAAQVAAGPAWPINARRRAAPARALLAALAAVLAVLVLAPLAPSPASASTTPRRLIALAWAETQAGQWYCYGGTGPCYDCSGLVMRAYQHAGIKLPRTTYGMLASWHLVWIPASQRKRGDLAFYGSGHVELVTANGTFGAASAGSPVGWHHPNAWWHPTMYFRIR